MNLSTTELTVVDCAYMERRRLESSSERLLRYQQSLTKLVPLLEPLPVVLEWQPQGQEHGYGYDPQALYLDGFMLTAIAEGGLTLPGLTLAWDGRIDASSTQRVMPTQSTETRVFVRQSACRCSKRSLDCELLTVKQYLQKTGRSLNHKDYLKVCRHAGAAYRQRYGETAPDLPELGSRARQLWVRHYPPSDWDLLEAAVLTLNSPTGFQQGSNSIPTASNSIPTASNSLQQLPTVSNKVPTVSNKVPTSIQQADNHHPNRTDQ